MWLKQMFKKQKGPPVQYPPPKDSQNNMIQTHFEIESQQQNTSPLIDNSPDNRYEQFQIMPHNKVKKFPRTILDQSQCVFMYQPGMFQASFMNDLNWQKLDIMLSDRQLALSPNILHPLARQGLNFFSMKYGYIEKSEIIILKNKKQQQRMRIVMKDNRQFYLRCVIGDMIIKVQEIITKFGFVNGINKFYAFRYSSLNRKLEQEFNGWKVYDIKRQFQRQGVILDNQNKNSLPLKYVQNSNGKISNTYPEILIIPSAMSDQDLKKCASFRTKERFPALTYHMQYSPGHSSLLFRCSQNKVGVMNARCKEDENMIKFIGEATQRGEYSKVINCKIYDARGYYAALGNMFAGKGYEKEDHYKNCQIEWLNIPNIHAVRDSYNKMISLNSNENFYQLIAESQWYQVLFLIISGAKSIALDLLNGVNVVVHCSDGWDRTSQLCALAQLILDPYYRTIQGFQVLVEKDWRHFGHKFRERTGQYRSTNYHIYEKSPIFIQFLDCIRQIYNQFPLSFEFNESFLLLLAKNVDSNIYGTFMTNNIQQANSVKITEKTISIWSHVKQNIQIYQNPYYRTDLSEVWLNPPTQGKFIYVWNQLFMGEQGIGGIEYHMMRQYVEIDRTLKNQFFANQQTIKNLEAQLKSLE